MIDEKTQTVDAEVVDESKRRSVIFANNDQQDILQQALAVYDVEKVEAIILRKNDILDKMCMLALQCTHEKHWTDQGGKPYLLESGCQVVAQKLGISIQIIEGPTREDLKDDKGEYFTFSCTVRGHSQIFGTQDESGHASSRDRFLGNKNVSNANPAVIRGKCISAAKGRLIRRMSGLQDVTRDQLNKHYKGGAMQKVNYKSRKQNNQSPQPDATPFDEPPPAMPAQPEKVQSMHDTIFNACYENETVYAEACKLISGNDQFKSIMDIKTEPERKALVARYVTKKLEEWVSEAETSAEKPVEGETL